MFVFITLSIFAFVFIYNCKVFYEIKRSVLKLESIIDRSMTLINNLTKSETDYPEKETHIEKLNSAHQNLVDTLKMYHKQTTWTTFILNIFNTRLRFESALLEDFKYMDNLLTEMEQEFKETGKITLKSR
jgi:uncharacterized membrane protein YgaE (UPF0421/DUF939 family)